jgi:hypothetical protein
MAKLPMRNKRMGYAVGDFVSEVPEQKTTLGTGEEVNYVPQTVDESTEIIPSTTGQLPSDLPAATTTTAGLSDLAVSVPATKSANTYSGYTSLNTPTALAAQGSMDSRSLVGEPSMTANATRLEQGVSAGSQATAAEGTVSSLGTVQGQLSNLMTQLNTDGADLPPWAAPAVRKVNAIMNQRGLGQSSMASAAITQAIYEAALPIASQDAKTYAAIDLANLTNRQQAVMQNATVYAAMDKANLDARMKAAVTNAQSFLSLDLTNMTEENKINAIEFQGKMQDLLEDQKAVNAAEQFNAKSETQVMEFFAELGTQIENANKTRVAAMKQFDVSEANAISKFNTQLDDARDKFNSQVSAQITQANANWRRQINTANTAGINETNRINAQNLLGLNATAQDQQWQRYRDEAQWLVTTAENAQDRAHKVALLGQQNSYNIDQYEKERWDILQDMVAETTFTGILNYITRRT